MTSTARTQIRRLLSALFALGLIAAACGDDDTAGGGGDKISLNSEQLRMVLPDMDEQAPNSFTTQPVTWAQTVEDGTFELPPQMAFDPMSCANYDSVLGVPQAWIQFGAREITEGHEIFFLQSAMNIPDLNLDVVKDSAATCEQGRFTLDDGTTKVDARVTFTFIDAPKIDGTTAFAMHQVTHFEEHTDPAEVALIESFGYLSATECIQYTYWMQVGDVVLLSQDIDQARSEQILMDMYNNVIALDRA